MVMRLLRQGFAPLCLTLLLASSGAAQSPAVDGGLWVEVVRGETLDSPRPVVGFLLWECDRDSHEAQSPRTVVPVEGPGRYSVDAGEVRDLGELTLQPGGAILGFVEAGTRSESPSVRKVFVDLEVSGQMADSPERRRRLEALRESQEAGQQGVFHFTGLLSGTYRVTAHSPGMAAAERSLVPVSEGQETELREALRLEPFIRQVVTIDPPRSPAGRSWTVSLRGLDSRRHSTTCRTDDQGSCALGQTARGSYKLRVEDLPGSIWWDRTVEIDSHGLPVRIELPVVPLEGQITWAGEPARARMFFRREEDGAAVEVYSDPKGRFEGSLPGDGEWLVTASLERDGAEADLGLHAIHRSGEGAAWLDLELPDTSLRGRVLRSAGGPAAGVSVYVHRTTERGRRSQSTVRTDEDGEFRVWGLAEGSYTARAVGPESAETTEEFSLREGLDRTVTIRLPGSKALRGRVSDLSGAPVAGAEVHVKPNLDLSEMPGVERSISGLDGRFEVTVPANAREVTVTVLPPGRAARIARLPIADGNPLEIVVRPWGGTLRLRQPNGRMVVGHRLDHADAWTWLGTLASWPTLHGVSGGLGRQGMTLPMMEPGLYRYCAAAEQCAEGWLEAGGDLELVLPAAE